MLSFRFYVNYIYFGILTIVLLGVPYATIKMTFLKILKTIHFKCNHLFAVFFLKNDSLKRRTVYVSRYDKNCAIPVVDS